MIKAVLAPLWDRHGCCLVYAADGKKNLYLVKYDMKPFYKPPENGEIDLAALNRKEFVSAVMIFKILPDGSKQQTTERVSDEILPPPDVLSAEFLEAMKRNIKQRYLSKVSIDSFLNPYTIFIWDGIFDTDPEAFDKEVQKNKNYIDRVRFNIAGTHYVRKFARELVEETKNYKRICYILGLCCGEMSAVLEKANIKPAFGADNINSKPFSAFNTLNTQCIKAGLFKGELGEFISECLKYIDLDKINEESDLSEEFKWAVALGFRQNGCDPDTLKEIIDSYSSIRELTERLFISKSLVSRWLSGERNISPDMLLKIKLLVNDLL